MAAALSRPGDAIEAVIFDMDGVLADSEPLHQHAIRVLLAEYGVDWASDGRDPTVGLTSLESFAVICARHALPHDPRRLDELYTARVLPLLRERVTPLPGVPGAPRGGGVCEGRRGLAGARGRVGVAGGATALPGRCERGGVAGRATAWPGRAERGGVGGAMSGPPTSIARAPAREVVHRPR